jgi:hypothetical protein
MPGFPTTVWANLDDMARAGPFFATIDDPASPYYLYPHERPSFAKAAEVFSDPEAIQWFHNIRNHQQHDNGDDRESLRDYDIHMINDTKQHATFVSTANSGPGNNKDDAGFINVHQRYHAVMRYNTKAKLDAFCRRKGDEPARYVLHPIRKEPNSEGEYLCSKSKPKQVNYLSWVWEDNLQKSMRVGKQKRKPRPASNNKVPNTVPPRADPETEKKNLPRKKRRCLANDYNYTPVISQPGRWIIDC